PDEVLRGGTAALTRGAGHAASADLSRRRPDTGVLSRSRRTVAVREDADRDLAGHPICRCHRRFPAQAVTAVRLVCAPVTVPGVRRHAAALPWVARGFRRQRRRVTDCYYRRLDDGETFE